ncbi:DsbC family protein [Pseudoduganella rivuli]|nr:DsbC family protein [Pseudoduganella rivuli]
MKSIKPALMLTSVLLASAAYSAPDDAALRRKLNKAYPGTQFTEIRRSPIPGLYEVWMGQNLAFVSPAQPRYLLFGRIFDTQNRRELSHRSIPAASIPPQETGNGPLAIDPAMLPLDDALVITNGTGLRKLFVFSDPRCPYCRQLDQELAEVPDVTIYHFIVPFQDRELAAAIWCSSAPVHAWRNALKDPSYVPVRTPACQDPLERNLALARRFKIYGTPTLIFPNGKRVDGLIEAKEILVQLAASAPIASSKEH